MHLTYALGEWNIKIICIILLFNFADVDMAYALRKRKGKMIYHVASSSGDRSEEDWSVSDQEIAESDMEVD